MKRKDPIFIDNLYTQELFNIEPLLWALSLSSTELLGEKLDEAIRLLVLYTEDVSEFDLKDVIASLYIIRDLFSELAARDISIE